MSNAITRFHDGSFVHSVGIPLRMCHAFPGYSWAGRARSVWQVEETPISSGRKTTGPPPCGARSPLRGTGEPRWMRLPGTSPGPRTLVIRGRGTMTRIRTVGVRCLRRVAHVDQLVRVDDEYLAAVDVLAGCPGRVGKAEGHRRVLMEAEEGAAEKALPLDRQLRGAGILAGEPLGGAREPCRSSRSAGFRPDGPGCCSGWSVSPTGR